MHAANPQGHLRASAGAIGLAAVLCTRRAATLLPLAPSGARVQQTTILLPSCTAAVPVTALLRAGDARNAETAIGVLREAAQGPCFAASVVLEETGLIWCNTENN